MFRVIINSLSYIVSVIIPLHLTLETVFLSKDSNEMSTFLKSTAMLQQQTAQSAITNLLLKYWTLYGLIYLLVPQTPLQIVINIIPLKSLILLGCNTLATMELLSEFIHFINEQKQFVTSFLKFMNNINDPKKSKFEQFTKLYQSSYTNYYNKKYGKDVRDPTLLDSFLFGAYTDSVVAVTKRFQYFFPKTNTIQSNFDFIILNILNFKNFIESYAKFAKEHPSGNNQQNSSSSEGNTLNNDGNNTSQSSGTDSQPGSFRSSTNGDNGTQYDEYDFINDLIEESKKFWRST